MAWTEEAIRAKHVEIARSYVGCDAEKDTKRYCDLVAPHGPEAERRFLATRHEGTPESGCGVVAVGLLRELCRAVGIHVDALEQPMSLKWLEPVLKLARENGAFFVPKAGLFPTVGCSYHVVAGNSQHWRTVVNGTPGSGPFDTIDGGAKNGAGFQAIATARPQLRGKLDVLSGKEIDFWIDVPKLVFNLRAKVGAAGLPGAAVTVTGDVASAVAETVGEVKAGSSTAISSPGTSSSKRIECLDIAGGQSANWNIDKLRAAGISAVWSRASDGADWLDAGFAANVAQTRRIGAEPGAYHFLRVRHGRPQDSGEQGRQHVVAARAQGVKLASWLDVERGPENDPRFTEHNAATREEWHEAIWNALESIERESGSPPLLYTYVAHLKWLALPSKFTRWRLVIADYREASKAPGPKEGLAPWAPDAWLGWQYAASPTKGGRTGTVDGIAIPVDRSVFRCSLDDLRVSSPRPAA